VFEMDASGTVTVVGNLPVGDDPEYVNVSSDGRFAVVSGATPSATSYSRFFINKEGSFTGYRTSIESFYGTAIDATHNVLFLFQPQYRSELIDYAHQTVYDTSQTLHIWEGQSDLFGYSPYLEGLVMVDSLYRYAVNVKTSPSGEFGEPTERFYFTGASNYDMHISSVGRFIAIAGVGVTIPKVTMLSVSPSGGFHELQSLFPPGDMVRDPYRVRYTPDGKFLLVLFDRREFLVSLAVDPQSGMVTEVDHVTRTEDDLGGYIIDALAITPDSKYVVTLSGNYTTNEQTFLVFRLEDDGQLPGYVSDMDFIPPYQEPVTAASTGWMFHQ